MAKFNVTYEVVTPESAELGDFADSGMEAEGVSLADAIRACGLFYTARGAFLDCGRWFHMEGEIDWRDGSTTSYAIHPPAGITAASYKRLARVLCGR